MNSLSVFSPHTTSILSPKVLLAIDLVDTIHYTYNLTPNPSYLLPFESLRYINAPEHILITSILYPYLSYLSCHYLSSIFGDSVTDLITDLLTFYEEHLLITHSSESVSLLVWAFSQHSISLNI